MCRGRQGHHSFHKATKVWGSLLTVFPQTYQGPLLKPQQILACHVIDIPQLCLPLEAEKLN